MTWSVDRSILGRKNRLRGAQGDPDGTWGSWTHWGYRALGQLCPLDYEAAGKSLGLLIPPLYIGDKSAR